MDPAAILNFATPFDQNKVNILDQLVTALYGSSPDQVYWILNKISEFLQTKFLMNSSKHLKLGVSPILLLNPHLTLIPNTLH